MGGNRVGQGGHGRDEERPLSVDPLLSRFDNERVGHLATVRPQGSPHIVPVVFAADADRIVTPIDWKPKTGRRLQRLINIEENASVSLLVQHYDEDWDQLWWIRADGEATIHEHGALFEEGVTTLETKYLQYRDRPIEGPLIVISPYRLSGWPDKV